ncbi:MAG: EAL domain-containing protein [Gammaproteobacteria bacterium]|nr:MAG: EAL domain-containing protein [Gammaproteobacteria bacterium]
MQTPDSEISTVFRSIKSEAELIYALGRYVVTELDLDQLLRRVAELVQIMTDAETVAVPIINPGKGDYEYSAAVGKNAKPLLGVRLPLSTGMCGWVLRNEQPLLFGLGHDMPMDVEHTEWHEGMESALLVPLISRGKIIGGLSAMGKTKGRSFDEKDLRLLTMIANQVSSVVENAQMVQELRHLATYDQLTRLVNRTEFEKRIANSLSSVSIGEVSNILCYLDLDQFKIVNDTSGHIAGDELLRQLSKVLISHVRDRDTVARLGGDEFGLLLEHCPIDKGIQIAESIRQAVEDFRFAWEGRIFKIGVSIGVVLLTAETGTVDGAMIAADQACLIAKKEGRNRVKVFSADDPALASHQMEISWISRIHDALEDNDFELFFQTIQTFDGSSNKGIHYEILLRMLGEQGEYIMPGGFISSAERFGLMPAIDRWVIRTYCHLLASNQDHIDKLGMCSINLSGQSLGDENIQQFIHEQIAINALPFDKFCFEITETSAITNVEKVQSFMQVMGANGVKFALDDFGSGMSSFNYLKLLPVDFIKIDGTFILDIDKNKINEGLVKSMIDIGHLMGKQVIAEFVESAEVLEVLHTLGADYAQGYGIAKPKPLNEILMHLSAKTDHGVIN